jgi:hypothetical protein
MARHIFRLKTFAYPLGLKERRMVALALIATLAEAALGLTEC